MNVSDVEVTAGLGGFLVLFGLALMLWFLGRDLSRRLRRMRQGEAERDQLAAAEQLDSTQAVGTEGDSTPTGGAAPAQEAGTEEPQRQRGRSEQDPAKTDPPVSPPRS